MIKIAKKHGLATLAAAGLTLAAMAPAHAGKTLDTIKSRGQVICGVNEIGRAHV